jgi:hypothetical protein
LKLWCGVAIFVLGATPFPCFGQAAALFSISAIERNVAPRGNRDGTGSAAPAARCRNVRRGSLIAPSHTRTLYTIGHHPAHLLARHPRRRGVAAGAPPRGGRIKCARTGQFFAVQAYASTVAVA